MRSGRFDRWSPPMARLALVALALLVLASALVLVHNPKSRSAAAVARAHEAQNIATITDPARRAQVQGDGDLALYLRVISRLRAGEGYYPAIVSLQRAGHYPVRPGFAVRLPTLAYLESWVGPDGQLAAALVLLAAVLIAWWRKLGADADSARWRLLAMGCIAIGASLGLNRYFFVMHELWSGMLLALAFGLHRMGHQGEGGRWIAAVLVAALALAIRELALPFVLLMLAFALWRRNGREAAAWALLVALFGVGMAWHLSLVAKEVLPGDPMGPSWMAMRGLSGWLANIVQSSDLRWLPHWLAGPCVVLMTFGWLGWNRPEGTFGFLLGAGYGLAFMVVGRWGNYYWGFMVSPVLFGGLAFAPRALVGLAERAIGTHAENKAA